MVDQLKLLEATPIRIGSKWMETTQTRCIFWRVVAVERKQTGRSIRSQKFGIIHRNETQVDVIFQYYRVDNPGVGGIPSDWRRRKVPLKAISRWYVQVTA